MDLGTTAMLLDLFLTVILAVATGKLYEQDKAEATMMAGFCTALGMMVLAEHIVQNGVIVFM